MSPSRPPAQRPPSKRSSGPNPIVIVVGVVALVLVAAVVAIVLTGGGDDTADGGGSGTTTPTVPVADGEIDPRVPSPLRTEVRPVEIEGASLPPMVDAANDPAIGQEIPTLVGEDAQAFVHTVSSGIDGTVVMVFLAHWCPACNQELPMLVDLERQGRLPDDVRVYGVLTGIDPASPGWRPTEWMADAGWPYSVIVDEPDLDNGTWKAADAFGLTGYPYVVVVNDGVVADRWSGASTADAFLARVETARAAS